MQKKLDTSVFAKATTDKSADKRCWLGDSCFQANILWELFFGEDCHVAAIAVKALSRRESELF